MATKKKAAAKKTPLQALTSATKGLTPAQRRKVISAAKTFAKRSCKLKTVKNTKRKQVVAVGKKKRAAKRK
jgi:hypothetical protein